MEKAVSATGPTNPFMFTGQWYDSEIGQYYLRARMYDPQMMRFTARDPEKGKQIHPLTFHEYLYCINDPLNNTDLSGRSAIQIANGLRAATLVYAAGLGIATYGASNDNFDLIVLGGYIQQLSGLAFAIGYGSTGDIVQVSRWGGGFSSGRYGIQGRPNFFNYMKTMKWLPRTGMVGPGTSSSSYYLADSLYIPRGALSFLDILFGFVKTPF